MSRNARILVAALTILCASIGIARPAHAQALPSGPEFLIVTSFFHLSPSVAIDEDGWSIVVWHEFFSLNCYACGVSPTGSVQWCTTIDQYGAAVYRSERPADIVALAEGEFMLVWEGWDDPFNFPALIKGRRVGSGGGLLGAEFVVASSMNTEPSAPRIALLPNARVIVVWVDDSSEGTDDSGSSVQARYIRTNGLPLGPRFQVNTTILGDQEEPDVAAAPDGRFAVVWHSPSSSGNDDSGSSVQLQRFGTNGLPSGGELQVNTYIQSDQKQPRVSMADDGSFVVVWQSNGSSGDDDSDLSVQARRFAAAGTPVGPDFQVNSYVQSTQNLPVVGVMGDGDFEVVWQSDGSPGDDDDYTSIQRQAYEADGSPIGPQLQVNTTTQYWQAEPDQAVTRSGEFVVVWSDYTYDFRGQYFGRTLFADGFESGDTSAWSATVP